MVDSTPPPTAPPIASHLPCTAIASRLPYKAIASHLPYTAIASHLPYTAIASHAGSFERVTVADPFNGPPLNGNPLGVVRGAPGWAVVGCFVLSYLLLHLHRGWLSRQARAAAGGGVGRSIGIDAPTCDLPANHAVL